MTINMDDLMDAIVANDSPSKVSDAIKDMLYSRTADKVDALKPDIASSLFGNDQVEDEVEDEPVAVAAATDNEVQE